MDGGTIFCFVADGIQGALEKAKLAVAGRDDRLGGGVATIRQYLSAGLVFEAIAGQRRVSLRRGAPASRFARFQ